MAMALSHPQGAISICASEEKNTCSQIIFRYEDDFRLSVKFKTAIGIESSRYVVYQHQIAIGSP